MPTFQIVLDILANDWQMIDEVIINGDQISLRVEPDGRVRAVALAMLKIEPQPDGPDGKRRFKLARKN